MRTKQSKKTFRIKQYMRTTYSSFWINQVQKYGFLDYHSNLLNVINSLSLPTKGYMLEVGVGTGWPFATTLADQEHTVVGVDLSENLVREAQAQPGNVLGVIGDAESLPLADESFNLVYCFQSTWYFPNLDQAISEMVRVTRPGGTLLFDVMNLASLRILWAKRPSSNLRDIGRNLRNIARSIIGNPSIRPPSHEHPTTHWRVSKILKSLPVDYRVIIPKKAQQNAALLDLFRHRLFYICNRL